MKDKAEAFTFAFSNSLHIFNKVTLYKILETLVKTGSLEILYFTCIQIAVIFYGNVMSINLMKFPMKQIFIKLSDVSVPFYCNRANIVLRLIKIKKTFLPNLP